MTNATDDRISYAQARELLGEMRRQEADFYKTWPLPGGSLSYAMYRDSSLLGRGYLTEDGFNRHYTLEVVA